MQYFTEDFIAFFKELSQNNNRDWFHEQKKRYESSVKKPFTAFLGDLIAAIQKEDASVSVLPKDCVLRINRDIRFSKDKTPYNTHYTAFVSKGGKKDKSIPGFFIRFSPEMIGVMGGCFRPDKHQLEGIKQTIAKDVSAFQALISQSDFAEKFGSIKGEKYKRIPKGFEEVFEKEPLISNKQLYFVAELDPMLISSENLLNELMELWHIMRPVNEYLEKAIKAS